MMDKPNIEVGIMSSPAIRFRLNGAWSYSGGECLTGAGCEAAASAVNKRSLALTIDGGERLYSDYVLLEPVGGDASFELCDVVIGINFHWERKEDQRFTGKLKLLIDEKGEVAAVNILPVEDYLLSVISSEMSATSSMEFLKAHAVISRSWLLAQLEKGKRLKGDGSYQTCIRNEEGYVKWYDREEHHLFDVCADDHCQRYQGVSRISSPHVSEALKATAGEALMYGNEICDARFHKCCGGVTEVFENVWEPLAHPYLTKVEDCEAGCEEYAPDLKAEHYASAWMNSEPPALCNTNDEAVLSQVMNDYDRETVNFFRWTVTILAEKLPDLLWRKIGVNVGEVFDLVPVERGVSGRIVRLMIKGSRSRIVIGKELEIRKALSETHLYSSAFVVDKLYDPGWPRPKAFRLRGAGWGHGVGLCQTGAAIMGARGSTYREILAHYFPQSTLSTIY